MGTRNLTMVIHGGKPVVAQYGQWDGYPEGQGQTVLDFLNREDFNVETFKNKLARCRFMTAEDDVDALNAILRNPPEWARTNHKRGVSYLSRDAAAEILGFIYETEQDQIVLVDDTDFATDGLMCEWVYVIDLDTQVVEVHRGFTKSAPDGQQRFSGPDTKADYHGYFPVQIVDSYPFSALPKSFPANLGSESDDEVEVESALHPERPPT